MADQGRPSGERLPGAGVPSLAGDSQQHRCRVWRQVGKYLVLSRWAGRPGLADLQVRVAQEVSRAAGRVQTGRVDNEITVVKLLECCLTLVFWRLAEANISPFHPNAENECHYRDVLWCVWSALIQSSPFKEAGRRNTDAAALVIHPVAPADHSY